jgi:hypothetical protein
MTESSDVIISSYSRDESERFVWNITSLAVTFTFILMGFGDIWGTTAIKYIQLNLHFYRQ